MKSAFNTRHADVVAEIKLIFHIRSIILFYYDVSCIFLPEEYNSARCWADYSFALGAAQAA